MPPAVDSSSRSNPVSLTPEVGSRAFIRGASTTAPTRPRAHFRELIRAEPTALHFVVAATFYWAVPWAVARLTALPLPHDDIFSAVVYLMWSGSAAASRQIAPMFDAATMVHLAAASVLIAAALLPRERMFAPVHATARRLYRYSIALPLWTILASNLARIVADGIYGLTGVVRWDMTPLIARFEAPFIEQFQHALASPAMSVFASNFYSAVWLAPVAFAGFLLVAADKPRAMTSLIIAYVLTSVCAIPFYVLLPTFDPWTTNAVYGAAGIKTGIRYLYTNPSAPTLAHINTTLHWAAGSAFPSLHVAFPLVISLVLRKHRMAWASAFMLLMTITTMFVIVYLGRHWMVDAIAAIPFAFAVVAIGERIPLSLVLDPHPPAPRFIQQWRAAVASVDDTPQWLIPVCFASGFAALLYQIVWQRTLFGILGIGTDSVALMASALTLGVGSGILIGLAIVRRATMAMWTVALAEIGIGVFGFFSMSLLSAAGDATMGSTAAAIAMFVVLLPPPFLMGAMLPLLAPNQDRRSDHTGRLYVVGVLGAVASGVAALVLLRFIGQAATVQLAAALNLGAGLLVLTRAAGAMMKR